MGFIYRSIMFCPLKTWKQKRLNSLYNIQVLSHAKNDNNRSSKITMIITIIIGYLELNNSVQIKHFLLQRFRLQRESMSFWWYCSYGVNCFWPLKGFIMNCLACVHTSNSFDNISTYLRLQPSVWFDETYGRK